MIDVSLILIKLRVEVKNGTLGNEESDFFAALSVKVGLLFCN